MSFIKKCAVVLISVALSGMAYARGPGGGMGSSGGMGSGGGQGQMGGQGRMGGQQQMSGGMGGGVSQGTQTQTRDPSTHTGQQPSQARERIHSPGTGSTATAVTN